MTSLVLLLSSLDAARLGARQPQGSTTNRRNPHPDRVFYQLQAISRPAIEPARRLNLLQPRGGLGGIERKVKRVRFCVRPVLGKPLAVYFASATDQAPWPARNITNMIGAASRSMTAAQWPRNCSRILQIFPSPSSLKSLCPCRACHRALGL